ncbi:hypothetical protein J6590_015095 [Homalodisca vitripennis]|nr:hypothetical protein J6590_015095 [Homalodisca vitripennis]
MNVFNQRTPRGDAKCSALNIKGDNAKLCSQSLSQECTVSVRTDRTLLSIISMWRLLCVNERCVKRPYLLPTSLISWYRAPAPMVTQHSPFTQLKLRHISSSHCRNLSNVGRTLASE